ncbi:MAG: hypothetical protein EOS55_23665 [Mesorhizobium sp.]|nr:MAG: hypothetical protein EOS55_23665 [Mesorhizobium sp.]
MAATKPAAGRFERLAKVDEIRQGAGIVKPALCASNRGETDRAGLEIDERTAQVGQAGGILHGVCPVANESPRRSFGYGIVRRNTKNLPG